MSISDGQAVSASVTNAAFVSKTADSTVTSKIDLNRIGSGAQVPDTQQAINDRATTTTVNAEFAARFDTTTGHDHDGTDSKKVLATDLNSTGAVADTFLKADGVGGESWNKPTFNQLDTTGGTSTQVFRADGAGGGAFKTLDFDDVLTTGGAVDEVYKSDGASGGSWQAEAGAGGGTAIGDNLLINGNLFISQRGDFTTLADHSFGYHLDRWYDDWSGHGNVQTQHISTSQPTGLSGSKSWRQVVQLSANGVNTIEQRIEAFQDAAGGSVTFAMWVKSDLDTAPKLQILDGVSTQSSASYAGAGAWEFMVHTVTISSSATLLTAKLSCDGVVTSGQFMEMTHAKLELGSVSTAFVARLPAIEFTLCQRYYQSSTRIGVAFPGSSIADLDYWNPGTAGALGFRRTRKINFATAMRSAATLNVADSLGAVGFVSELGVNDNTAANGVVPTFIDPRSFGFNIFVTLTTAGGSGVLFEWEADSEL